MTTIFGYCRVSSEEQAQRGISIEAQRNLLQSYAQATGQQIRIFEDAGFSGKNTQRPALLEMLSALNESVSSVLVWKLDRLSRSLRDTLSMIEDQFQPRGITLVSITESIDTSSPSGRMMLNMLASFAQLEREQDSDRVVMAHKHLAAECRYLGGHVPLGYCIDDQKRYQLDPVTAPIVRHVFQMYLSRCGYTEILSWLNAQQLPAGTRRTQFNKPDLNFMLNNEIYSGTFVRRMGADPRHKITSPETIRVPGGVPAILSQDEWNRVCEIREHNRTTASRARASSRIYPLSGLVRCGVCGSLMKVNVGGKTRAGELERYYKCEKNRCFPPPRVEAAETAVFQALHWFANHEDALRKSCAIANSYAAGVDSDRAAEIRDIRQRIQDEKKRSAQIVAFVAKSGADAPLSMMDELQTIEKRIASLTAKIDRMARPVSRYDADKLVQAVRAADEIEKLPPDQQRQLIQAAVHHVTVTADEFNIFLLWPKYGGDEPPQYIGHTLKREIRNHHRQALSSSCRNPRRSAIFGK